MVDREHFYTQTTTMNITTQIDEAMGYQQSSRPQLVIGSIVQLTFQSLEMNCTLSI
jgi:hypothetical protein